MRKRPTFKTICKPNENIGKITENQKEFAAEIVKLFSFEELALCFYDNECEYCPKQLCCDGHCSTKECATNIRQNFEKRYFRREEEE